MALRTKYAPGSFTKNFAWAGTGFKRLHTAIRAGYKNKLAAVQRNNWRADSGINDSSLDLIPINFFLHNKDGRMSVDELVFQAIHQPHTIDFDRLALFAFHLSQVGTPPLKGPQRPALWANEFAREVLWKRDNWQSAALDQEEIDKFIALTMNGQEDVRVKSRNNYRYFFELAGYLPSATTTINTASESWVAPALYLTWDRFLLDGGRKTVEHLLQCVKTEELHKLIGISEASITESAKAAAPEYLIAGALARFNAPASPTAAATTGTVSSTKTRSAVTTSPSVSAKTKIAPPTTTSAGTTTLDEASEPEAAWLDEDGSDDAVTRSLGAKYNQKRNRKIAAELRLHYKHTCMFCGTRLQIGDNRFYAEAAHIKPLGLPHSGPDKTSNLLVLCPNHHLQFDRGIIRLEADGTDFRVRSSIAEDALDNKLITLKHSLDAACVSWHYEWFDDKRTATEDEE